MADIYDKLYKKLKAEYEQFEKEIETVSRKEVRYRALEIAVKDDLMTEFDYICTTNKYLDREIAEKLYGFEHPLNECWLEWCNTDQYGYNQTIIAAIEAAGKSIDEDISE
ncbi:MAG: DUF3848 domain-containing protein [Ruminococcus sp.]|nr:DUF3848 domain-containing protein [Ruminococcus sp.]